MNTLPFLEAAEIVKSTLDIVDIVSRHVVLRKAGRNHTGLCPFHPEKSPSFNVSREKNLFKCFGCGEAGDALTFIMKHEHKTYGEVIRELAGDQGIQIISENVNPEQYTQQQDTKQKILTLNERAQLWFYQQLGIQAGQEAKDYLERRQISGEIIESFGLGYAPQGWENLTQYLMHQIEFVRANPEILVDSGLASNRMEGGGCYDRFRNRLIIPIYDDQGRVVGFGGRALTDEDKPKYLNSPETQVYVKNRILYGLFQAKEAIRQSKYAVVMEGYFDVISAHWAGIPQAVGSCGTALTENHLKLLTRFGAETVYLAFDSDDAGLKAAISGIDLIEPYLPTANITVKIVVIPRGKDPDEFIRQEGGDAFKSLLTSAQSFLDFKFSYALRGMDLHSPEGRLNAVNRITPLLSRVGQPVLRSEYMKQYADQLKVSEEALSLEVKRYERAFKPYKKDFEPIFKKNSKKDAISKNARTSFIGTHSSVRESMAGPRKPLDHRHVSAEKSLLGLIFLNTESYLTMSSLFDQLQFTHPLHQGLLEAVIRVGRPDPATENTLDGLIRKLQTELVEKDLLQRVLADAVFTAESMMRQLELETLSPSMLAEKVLHEAEKYKLILDEHQKEESLKHLATQARDIEQSHANVAEEQDELSLLELQYQIREKLSKRKKELL